MSDGVAAGAFRQSGPTELDHYMGTFAGMRMSAWAQWWKQGDFVADALAAMASTTRTKGQARRMRRLTLRSLAGCGFTTAGTLAAMAECALTFEAHAMLPDGTTPVRSMDRNGAFYVAVLKAAKRTKTEEQSEKDRALEILQEALALDWHLPQIAALGRVKGEHLRGDGDCAECGAIMRIKLEGDAERLQKYNAIPLVCAVCVGYRKREHLDTDDAPVLGDLEAPE